MGILTRKGLKDFMIEQIESSIEFDICFYKDIPFKDYEVWLREKNEKFERDIKYHTLEHEKEIGRVNEMNEWIKKLRESLK